jgi:hypothetical protein
MDLFPAYLDPGKTAGINGAFRSERRKRVRTTVHWPVLFFRNEVAEAIESTTQDLSSSGFYCLSRTLFVPGELLFCTLKVPSYEPLGQERARILECRARVMRAEPVSLEGFFGIACQIEDYRFLVGNRTS